MLNDEQVIEEISTPGSTMPQPTNETLHHEDNDDEETPLGPQRKCGHCYVRGSDEIKLKYCSQCHGVQYCSKECQVANWKKHKPVCIVNRAQALQLAMMDSFSGPMPGNLSYTELDANLEKWIKIHGNTFMRSTIHALRLPVSFNRSHTHILRMVVSFNHAHSNNPSKYFNIGTVEVISFEDAKKLDGAWELSVKQLKVARDDSERVGRGTVVAVGIECAPLAVQIVPFGSIRKADMKKLKLIEDWEKELRKFVETGNRIH